MSRSDLAYSTHTFAPEDCGGARETPVDTRVARSVDEALFRNAYSIMPSANDIRKGNVIKYNNEPQLVMDVHHRTPGNLRAFVQAKLRNLRTGKSGDVRFSSTESVEVLMTERQNYEFSYADRDVYCFLHPETFEQIELNEDLIADSKNFLVPNSAVEVLFVDGNPVQINLPSSMVLEVTEAPEGIRGDTASNVQKSATLETGLTLQVPLFIKPGDKIKVSTSDNSYMGRA